MIKERRFSFDSNNKSLNRARRLYKRLVAKQVNYDQRASLPIAFKAIKAGLWAESTGVRDIAFTLRRAAHRLYGEVDWWDYMDRSIYDYANECYGFSDGKCFQKRKPKFKLLTKHR